MREFDFDEIEELNRLKDETNKIDMNLEENEIKAAHALLRKNISTYLTSSLQLHTLKSPRSCYLTLRLDHENDNIIDTISKILTCVAPPFRIYLDFFCLASSATEPDLQLVHPSISTCFNDQKLIMKKDDKEKLLDELSTGNFNEKILEKHHLVRRFFF